MTGDRSHLADGTGRQTLMRLCTEGRADARVLRGATPQAGEGVAPPDGRQFNSRRAQGGSLMGQGPGQRRARSEPVCTAP